MGGALREYVYLELKENDKISRNEGKFPEAESPMWGVFRDVRKIVPLACRRLIAISVTRKQLYLEEQYRSFAQYRIEYLEVEEEKYNTYREEDINCSAQMRA